MESTGLIIWLKSVANVIIGGGSGANGENGNYFTLTPNGEEKTPTGATANGVMDSSDRNNNPELFQEKIARAKSGKLENGKLKANGIIPTSQLIEPPERSIPSLLANGKSSSVALLQAASPKGSNDGDHPVSNGHVTCDSVDHQQPPVKPPSPSPSSVACCDIIKYKNELSVHLRSSPHLSSEPFKSGPQTFQSSAIIEAILDVLKGRQLFRRCDPFVSAAKSHNLSVTPLVTACIRNCTITGFSNVERAGSSDGVIRYLGSGRFSLDCPISIRDIRGEANYAIKLGHRWGKRLCLRNKSLTLKLDRCLIYVEVIINRRNRTVTFERFSPISQSNVRCKTAPFGVGSLDTVFCTLLQRYFGKYVSANLLKVESQARRYLDRSSLLPYDDIVSSTALNKLFDCFADLSTSSLTSTLAANPPPRPTVTPTVAAH